MSNVAVLGLGAMGSRMAINLIEAGHTVSVWNRTPEQATSLVAAGARQAKTPRQAPADADFVVTMLRDDEASREVWLNPETGPLAGMEKGSVGIESSTLTPDWIRELGAAALQRGISLIEAPVAGSRPQAAARQLVYFVGGNEATLKQAEPILKALGSTIHHVGALGTGALVKLATNALLGVQVTALAELIALLQRAGVDADRAIKVISSTAAWSPAANYLSNSMLTGNFAPQFPVELIEKDFGYTVRAASSSEAVPTISAARAVFQNAIASGFGADNMTGVVRLFTKQGR